MVVVVAVAGDLMLLLKPELLAIFDILFIVVESWKTTIMFRCLRYSRPVGISGAFRGVNGIQGKNSVHPTRWRIAPFRSIHSQTPPTPTHTPKPTLTHPSASKWLYSLSALIAGIVVVGGVTRLTESGLSITEWKPITGVTLPRGEDWQAEFDKYKQTPEYRM